MEVKNITDAELSTTITQYAITLVDFWAPWCGPCREQGPIVDELANEVSNVAIVKVNIDSDQQTAQTLGIMSIPTLVLYKNGVPIEKMVGVQTKETLKQAIQKHSA